SLRQSFVSCRVLTPSAVAIHRPYKLLTAKERPFTSTLLLIRLRNGFLTTTYFHFLSALRSEYGKEPAVLMFNRSFGRRHGPCAAATAAFFRTCNSNGSELCRPA